MVEIMMRGKRNPRVGKQRRGSRGGGIIPPLLRRSYYLRMAVCFLPKHGEFYIVRPQDLAVGVIFCGDNFHDSILGSCVVKRGSPLFMEMETYVQEEHSRQPYLSLFLLYAKRGKHWRAAAGLAPSYAIFRMMI